MAFERKFASALVPDDLDIVSSGIILESRTCGKACAAADETYRIVPDSTVEGAALSMSLRIHEENVSIAEDDDVQA